MSDVAPETKSANLGEHNKAAKDKNGTVNNDEGEQNAVQDGEAESETQPAKAHEPKCRCGCVPDILSLIEMAALRKKYREQQQQQKLHK
jgi:hypothetical protein